jgi:diaminopimelate decarboxylase/aspartate kinase
MTNDGTNGNTRQWVVMKFGGTSVSSADCWSTISEQVHKRIGEGSHVLIVVSALSGVTNLLTALADGVADARREEILAEMWNRHLGLFDALGVEPSEEFTKRWREFEAVAGRAGPALKPGARADLLAQGELLSSAIGAVALARAGLDPVLQDARNLLEALPESAGQVLAARCGDHADPALTSKLAGEAALHITQGFLVAGQDGQTCLLGRGGSDTSAAYLAARLQAATLEIWTDVPGIFSADPRVVPDARLLNRLSYSEAQELASMGAKVLHPPSIQPAQRHRIPVFIRDTNRPDEAGTRIGSRSQEEEAQVKGVVSRQDITLISMENTSMWRQAGFLADAFAVFKRHGFSVDLISTSESTVTVSLDPEMPAHTDERQLDAFLEDLSGLCKVRLHSGCMSISLVGNAIRTILGRLSAALDVFQDRHVHMVTQSANDLNLTLVVDPEHAVSLVRKLHQLLIASQADNRPEFGPSWAALTRLQQASDHPEPWWKSRAEDLHRLVGERDSAYVYNLENARLAARRLQSLESIGRVLYSVKANDHVRLLQALAGEGLGFECVSMEEVAYVLDRVPDILPEDILFTPNFAPWQEYQAALDRGVQLTVDNSWVLQQWPEMFAGHRIFLRLDLDSGYGHHKKVITSGADSKFGISLDHIARIQSLLRQHGIRVCGLHAHTGSGVSNTDVWQEQLQRLLAVLPAFPDVEVLDLGGGLGVPDRPGQPPLDLQQLDLLLRETLGGHPVSLWLEPGRYLAAESGVLLSRVTQLKSKGQYHYLGVSTGMNSLIRPALYGAYHEIVNLTRLDEPAVRNYRVVGPICESGDVLGDGRMLPESQQGDLILIANAGAYGRVMSSRYNRREPAAELIL